MDRMYKITFSIATALTVVMLLSGYHISQSKHRIMMQSYKPSSTVSAKVTVSAKFTVSAKIENEAEEAVTVPQTFRPKIVLWAKPYHSIDYTIPTLSNGDGACDISFNRQDISSADAVVFFMKSANPKDLPNKAVRKPNQVYVWWCQESPWTVRNYYHHRLTEYNNYFNWTMAFRMDSDVIAAMWPVSILDFVLMKLGRKDEMIDKDLASKPPLSEEEYQREVKHLLSLKTKLVSWIASDCSVTWGAKHRRKVVGDFEREGQIKMDKFGKCANNPIPLNNTILFQKLSPYKFYLAFENSWHCKDYLTEKTTFNAFVGGSVPVVFGPSKANTAELLPPKSFIHVEDFKDMGELAAFLKYLDKNDTAYMEYFNWWKAAGLQNYPRFGFNYGPRYLQGKSSYRRIEKGEFQDDWQEVERFGIYHLCRRLMQGYHKKHAKTVPDLAKWFYGVETRECLG